MFTQSAGIQHRHTQATGIQQAAIQHMLTHTAYRAYCHTAITHTQS